VDGEEQCVVGRSRGAVLSRPLSELQVQNAITRQKKEEIVKELQGKLEGSVIVFGLRFKNLNVSSLDASLALEGVVVADGRVDLSLAAASAQMQLNSV
jgi:hypothetical protein